MTVRNEKDDSKVTFLSRERQEEGISRKRQPCEGREGEESKASGE